MFHPTLHCILHRLACARPVFSLSTGGSLKLIDAAQKRGTLRLKSSKVSLPSFVPSPTKSHLEIIIQTHGTLTSLSGPS